MITVSGASDDLIEVDGDIYEEFSALGGDDTGGILGFSNGVVLRIRYDEEGVWRITPITGASNVSIALAPEADEDNYSDVATLLTPADWVVFGDAWARSKT
jgi:hypothetical protein